MRRGQGFRHGLELLQQLLVAPVGEQVDLGAFPGKRSPEGPGRSVPQLRSSLSSRAQASTNSNRTGELLAISVISFPRQALLHLARPAFAVLVLGQAVQRVHQLSAPLFKI